MRIMATIQEKVVIQPLLNRYSLEVVVHILRDIDGILTEDGKSLTARLEAECAARPGSRLSVATTLSCGRSLHSPVFDRSYSSMSLCEGGSTAESNRLSLSLLPECPESKPYTPQTVPAHVAQQRQTHGHRYTATPRRQNPKNSLKAIKASAGASSPVPTTSNQQFGCPFCAEVLDEPPMISRKPDLKRHFGNFHHNNAQWICPGTSDHDCGMSFDWKQAFEHHLKKSHGVVQYQIDHAMVKLQPQLVFACGFTQCRQVFEASSPAHAEEVVQEYFKHVITHFQFHITYHDWSYTTRFRNLMRQRAIDGFWDQRNKGAGKPEWQPHTSSVLRKMLETSQLPANKNLFVQWAVRLGSLAYCKTTSPLPTLPSAFQLPFLEGDQHALLGDVRCIGLQEELDAFRQPIDHLPQPVEITPESFPLPPSQFRASPSMTTVDPQLIRGNSGGREIPIIASRTEPQPTFTWLEGSEVPVSTTASTTMYYTGSNDWYSPASGFPSPYPSLDTSAHQMLDTAIVAPQILADSSWVDFEMDLDDDNADAAHPEGAY